MSGPEDDDAARGTARTQIGVGKLGSDPAIEPNVAADEPVTKASDPALQKTLQPPSDGTTGRVPLEGGVESLIVVDRAHYEVQGEFGRGGLGRVLRARDRRTGRIVAIKEALRATPGLLARFAREALVTANLQHPAIVPVYEVGRWTSGEPFYAMKLVAGRSLAEAAMKATTLRARLALLPHVIGVADALAYAHGERVIHRDLKPANVLIGDYGETVVIDWGLAKRLGDVEDVDTTGERAHEGKTMVGSVMGTPGYMAPEQARGEPVDERADVYAVGAMLYELLSGRRPYAETTSVDEVLRLAAEQPPPRLAAIDLQIPRELVAIVERAMAFSPSDRYRDARALAEDLKRFQTGQLVGAHQYTAWQLVARWLRRHAAVVTAAAIGVVALAALGGYSIVRIQAARDRALAEQKRAVAAQALAEDRAAALAEEQGRQLTVSGDPARGLPYLAAAVEAGRQSTGLAFVLARALDSLDRVEAVLAVSSAPLDMVSYSPDGAQLVTCGLDGTVRIYDAHAHRLVRELGRGAVARWTPEGPIVALSEDGTHIELRDPTTGASHALPGTLSEPSGTLAVAPGQIAVGSMMGTLTWWVGTAAPVVVPHAHAKPLRDLQLSPDGTLIASAADDGQAKVWRVADGAPVGAFTMSGPVRAVGWSPDSTRLVAGSSSYELIVWNVKTGAVAAKLAGHKDSVESARFDATGTRVLSGSRDNTAIVWDVATGKQLAVMQVGHKVVEAMYSPDGTWIAARDEHGDISLFTAEGVTIAKLAGHTGSLSEVAFSPNGAQLASVGLDGDLRLWRLAADAQLVTLSSPAEDMWRGTFTRDGALVAITAGDGVVRLYDGHSGALVRKLAGHRGRITAVDFSRDGTLVSAGEDGTLKLWAPADGRLVHDVAPGGGRVRGAKFSPDGTRIATTHGDGTIRLWTAAGEPMFTVHASKGEPRAPLWSPDGTRLVVSLDHGGADLLSADGKLLGSAIMPVEFATTASWSHDGAQFALGGNNLRAAYVYDGKTAAPVRMLEGHTLAPLWVIDPAPGDNEMMTASADGTARLWHDGTTRLALGDGSSGLMSAAYRGDGAMVALGDADGFASVWDTTTGKQLARLAMAAEGVPVVQLVWSPDGERVLALTYAGAKLWKVPAWHGTLAELATRLHCALHWRLDAATLVPATPDPAACR